MPLSVKSASEPDVNMSMWAVCSAIQSLCWSCDFPGGWCYLCVVQYQKISIWRVEGSCPNLKLKLVRKISKNPLPQGKCSLQRPDVSCLL